MAHKHSGVSNLSVWMQDQAEIYAAKKFANDQAVKAASLAQEQAKAEQDALQDALEMDYADDYETRRDLRSAAVQ